MSFISYSQNFEDVMLWRALNKIESGFYIDIGAQDPVVDSVSLAFYENGWRGVHVEPTQQYSSLLRSARPDEIVEQIAIGTNVELLTFYEFTDTGLSTAELEIAKRHQAQGFEFIETKVEVASLDTLLKKHANSEIHWLKIDVEGHEKNVLESWQISDIRPWILVIESTKPLTQEQNHHEWQALVFDKGYKFAYFDGVNRFYIHQNHLELITYFNAPPNIFDDFALSGTASQPFYQIAESKFRRAEARAQQAESRAYQADAELVDLKNSLSWRMTAPFRFISLKLKATGSRLHSINFKAEIKKDIKLLLMHFQSYISNSPKLRSRCGKVLKYTRTYPFILKIYKRAMNFSNGANVVQSTYTSSPQDLSFDAQSIYHQLKTAIALEQQKENK